MKKGDTHEGRKVVEVLGKRKVGDVIMESIKCDDGCIYDREVKK